MCYINSHFTYLLTDDIFANGDLLEIINNPREKAGFQVSLQNDKVNHFTTTFL